MNQMEQNVDIIHYTRNRKKDRIQILTTLNGAYLPRLQVLLTSIRVSQPEEAADIWLMHSGIPQEDLEPVARSRRRNRIRIPSSHDRQYSFCRCACQPPVSP